MRLDCVQHARPFPQVHFAIDECAVLHCARQGGSSDASVGCLAHGIGRRKRESSFALTSGYEIGENAVPTAK